MPTVALVAHSARTMAQAAVQGGYRAVAIDLFGDLDTRRACSLCLPAGTPGTMQIDMQGVLGHLQRLAQDPDVIGWVAGAGCEGQQQLLTLGAAVLPLIGSSPLAVQRVRQPETFFAWLREQGLEHPAVSFLPPADGTGWLSKDPQGCGGWHVRPAAAAASEPLSARRYFQRRAAGRAMSATFCGTGRDAVVLGFNEAVAHAGGLPFVHGGVVGPVELPAAVAAELLRAVGLLSSELGLLGLGSLDFMFDGTTAHILEVNPRPSASMALYADRVAGGLMRAHIEASLHGRLPQVTPPEAQAAVRGECIVFARRAQQVGSALSQHLLDSAHCHDLPAADTVLGRGDPLCSVSAAGPDAAHVRQLLRQRHDAVLELTESQP